MIHLAKWLLLGCTTWLSCLSVSTYRNIQLQSSPLLIEPYETAATGLHSIKVLVTLKDSQKQLPIVGIPIDVLAGTSELITSQTHTDERGQLVARFVSHEVGSHYVNVQARVGNQLIALSTDEIISFRAALAEEQPAQTAGEPGSFPLIIPPPSTYPLEIAFRSTDPLATLPNNFRVTSEQDLYRVFVGGLTFRTAGLQVLTTYNAITGQVLNEQSFMIEPGYATQIQWRGPSQTIAGDLVEGRIQLLDTYNNIASLQEATLIFASSIEPNHLPPPIVLTAREQGEQITSFRRFIAANQQIVISDPINPNLQLSFQLHVLPNTPHHIAFQGPLQAKGCQPIPNLKVGIEDIYNNIVPISGIPITLSSLNHPLTGTPTLQTLVGIAHFNNISFQQHTAQEQLIASTPQFDTVQSQPFPITIAPPHIQINTIDGIGGCIDIHYTVSQACSLPVDLWVDYQLDSQPFQVASGTRLANGIYQLPTTPMGSSHTFTWDSSKDAPRAYTQQARLRLQAVAKSKGQQQIVGNPYEQANITLDNTIRFTQHHSIPWQTNTLLQASGDFNRDGRQDLLTAEQNQLHRWMQDPNHQLELTQTLSMPADISYLMTLDLNRDGAMDVLITFAQSSQIKILWGTGTGPFEASATDLVSLMTSLPPVLLDIDQDSFMDIAIASGATIELHQNLRNKTFMPPSTIAAAATIVSMAAGDGNRDGITDLLLALSTHQLQWLEGQSNTWVPQPPQIEYDLEPVARLVLSDVDGNGWLDIVTQSSQTPTLFIQRTTGPFVHSPPVLLSLPYLPHRWSLLDIDHNGQIDLWMHAPQQHPMWRTLLETTATPAWHQISNIVQALDASLFDHNLDGYMDMLWLSHNALNINQSEPTAQPCSSGFRGARPISCASSVLRAVDLNQDGSLDPIAACDDQPSHWLHIPWTENQTVSFPGYNGYPFSYPGPFGPIFVHDFNQDQNQDILFVTHAGQQWTVGYEGNDVFRYTNNPLAPPTLVDYLPIDANHDGILDMAYLAAATNQLVMYYNDGQGLFTNGLSVTIPPNASQFIQADLNNDTYEDLIVLHHDSSMITFWLSQANGTWLAPYEPLITPSFPESLVVTDINGDQRIDLIVYCDVSQQVVQWFNDGTGQFSTPHSYRVQNRIEGMAAGDINLDGFSDLILSFPDESETEIWTGRSVGIFEQTFIEVLTSDDRPNRPMIADLNNDRLPDISILGNGNVYTFYNQGKSRFNELFAINAPPQCSGLTSADFSGDGQIDVVLGCQGNRSINLYTGNGDGTVVRKPMQFVSFEITQLLQADINRDSIPDIVMRHRNPDGFSIFYFNRSLQTFDNLQTITTPSELTDLALEDLNLDGQIDVVALSQDSQTLTTYLRSGSTYNLTHTTTYPDAPYTMTLADLNRDGLTDVVLGDDDIKYQLNLGNGTLATPVVIASTPDWINNLETVDFNRDGFIDIVFSVTSDGVWMGYGSSGITFSTWNNSLLLDDDFRSNSSLRVLTSPLEQGGPHYFIHWLIGDTFHSTWITNGTNLPSRRYTTTGTISEFGINLADMNQDGALDILSISDRLSPRKSRLHISKQYR